MNLFFSSTIFTFSGALLGASMAHYACIDHPDATLNNLTMQSVDKAGKLNIAYYNSSNMTPNENDNQSHVIPDICAAVGSSVGSLIGLGLGMVLFSLF